MYRTNIDDLLDLDDPSDSSEGMSSRNFNSYTNAIRKNNNYSSRTNAMDGAKMLEQQRQLNNYYNKPPTMYNSPNVMHNNVHNKPIYNNYNSHNNNTNLSCRNVVDHIQDCPICSKFYNNDVTVYIVIIVVLIIICLLLLKKVLDV